MAQQYIIEITQGTDILLPLLVQTSDSKTKEVKNANLTGCTAKLQIRKSSYSGSVIDELSTENKRIQLVKDTWTQENTDEFPSVVYCKWTNKETANYPVGKHRFQVELTTADDIVYSILEGNVVVTREVVK